MEYLAIIGDVRASREVEDRAGLQESLRAGLSEVNARFKDTIAASFLVTIGDEFQGLLTSPEEVDLIIASLRVAVHPVQLRFGIGFGPLETALSAQAIGMDGPCFHRARAGLETAKRRGTYVEVGAEGVSRAFGMYALLYSQLRDHWTDKQREIVDLSSLEYTGVEIAARLEISQPAVSQQLRAAGAERIWPATRLWMEELGKLVGGSGAEGG